MPGFRNNSLVALKYDSTDGSITVGGRIDNVMSATRGKPQRLSKGLNSNN